MVAAFAIAVWGIAGAVGGMLGGDQGQVGSEQQAGGPAVITDATSTDPGDIVIGLNGDEHTIVLKGEEYLEAGAHAAEPTDGILSSKIKSTGTVDTSKVGTYEVTYAVSDSTGHTATATRTVEVVDHMDTMQGGMPVLMYHYVYSADDPPPNLDANYLLDTDLEAQLQYLTENDFYFPSYPEIRAFIQGTHSLPAKSVALTFDDGEMGFLLRGVPIIERYRVPVTSFIIANDEASAQNVITHHSPYVSFQSHSYAMHQGGGTIGHGGRISAMSTDEIVADLKQAQAVVGATEAFAYPFGDVTDDAREAVDEAGVLCAFTTENDWASVGDDVRALPRVRISGGNSLDSFKSLVNASA